MMLSVTEKTFEKEVGEELALVQFWAPWCGPCKMQTPVLESLQDSYEGKIKFVKVNIDENQNLSSQFGIMSIPNMIVLDKGKLVDNFIGLHQKGQVQEILNRHI
ncbi:MAG: thioredoxin [Vagococcus sp.]|nr:thioredoxin [Vagococcus sp.]